MKPSKQKSNIRLSKRKKTKSRKIQNKSKKTHSRQQKNNKKKRSHRKIVRGGGDSNSSGSDVDESKREADEADKQKKVAEDLIKHIEKIEINEEVKVKAIGMINDLIKMKDLENKIESFKDQFSSEFLGLKVVSNRT